MRNILFRGKRLDNGEWVYGYYDGSDRHCKFIWVQDLLEPTRVDPATVGQYTGLDDKHGVKIFEGDVCRSKSHSPSDYTVKWADGGFYMGGSCYPIDINHFYPSVGTSLVIIGNIHDNPELLNG